MVATAVAGPIGKSCARCAESGQGSGTPRDRVTRNDGPNSALAAVAPSTTMTSGRNRANSATSHGRQARPGPGSGAAAVCPARWT